MQHVRSICNRLYREEEKGRRAEEKRGQGEEEGRWRWKRKMFLLLSTAEGEARRLEE